MACHHFTDKGYSIAMIICLGLKYSLVIYYLKIDVQFDEYMHFRILKKMIQRKVTYICYSLC
jgi:hypothetical protein